MFVPILIIIGIFAIAAAGSPRERSYTRALPAAPLGPIAALGRYRQAGYLPPREVVLCAIAEAQMMGRNDIAHGIAHEYLPNDPAIAPPVAAAAPIAPPPVAPAPMPAAMPVMGAMPVPDPSTASDAEIQAMLDRNPRGFVQAARACGPITATEPARRAPPIPGVPDAAWDGLCTRLERESPTYESSRHVGRYRQRRERLIQLGIDPAAILGSPEMQQAALEAELADAHRHIVESGMAAEVIGRPVAVPGVPEPVEVTMSGVLGIAQAAGLDGALGWLESQEDRRRFPHTTAAFVKTNGVF